MAGMLQILTWLLSFYLVIKGLQVLMMALASARENRTGLVLFGMITLAVCVGGAVMFTTIQDRQAQSLSENFNRPSTP